MRNLTSGHPCAGALAAIGTNLQLWTWRVARGKARAGSIVNHISGVTSVIMGVPHFGGGEFPDVVPRTHVQVGRSGEVRPFTVGSTRDLSTASSARLGRRLGELIAEMPPAPAGRSPDQKRFRRNVALLQRRFKSEVQQCSIDDMAE